MVSSTRRLAAASVAVAAAVALVAGCGASNSDGSGASGELTLWTHNAGNVPELGVVQKIVDDFNASQTTYKVKIQAFPQTDYNNAVAAAAAAKKLPCLLDVDGPNVPNWAWGGYLAPMDVSGSAVPLSDQLPSTVGKYQDKVYSFGFYDLAMSFFSRKSVLNAAGVRIPTLDQPWTKTEFADALSKIKATGKFAYPLDMGTGGNGEWWSYGYSPQLQSFGGDLINRSGYKSAKGTLNGPQAVAWGTWFRSLVTDGYIAQKSGTSKNDDFLNGKSAIVWDGSWDAATDAKQLGDDLAVIPPVDFGNGPKIGGASWQWAMGAGCSNKNGAQAWLKFARQTKYYVDFAKALGTIPATDAAAAQIDGFQAGGPQNYFLQEAHKFAQVRPVTPAYPFISTVFQKTAQDILAGAPVQSALDQAANQIDDNIKTNGDYAG